MLPLLPSLASISELAGIGTLVVFAAIFASPIMGSIWLNDRLRKRNPLARSFAWGYFMAFGCFIAPVAIGASANDVGAFIATLLIYAPIGIFVFRRHRWALILATLLSFNPIIWIANSIYITKRWKEMGASPALEAQVSAIPV